MKNQETKQAYIRMRAEGKSYNTIASALNISKTTCSQWEKELSQDIALLKQEELNSLYETFFMKKEARIKQLGSIVSKIDDAIANIDFNQIQPDKLLDIKLKYMEALQKEYITIEPLVRIQDNLTPGGIMEALADLADRVRTGLVQTDQVSKEVLILSNLIKAYETTELKTKIDILERALEVRQ